MADQTIVKPLGLKKDLKIFVHGIPYIISITLIQSSALDYSYYMLLSHPWLKDVKMFHDQGNNTIPIIVQKPSTVKTIFVTKKLGAPTK